MSKIILSLSDDLYELVEREVAAGEFADDAAFVESLIREHRDRKVAALVSALEEGERSGPSGRTIAEIYAEVRQRYLEADPQQPR